MTSLTGGRMIVKRLIALLCALVLCLAGLSAWAEEEILVEGGEGMRMMIGETPVTVEWEDNEAVEALRALASASLPAEDTLPAEGPLPVEGPLPAEGLTIEMSMYGGFEQVGDIGQSLPRDDAQTTTVSGDIVLYAGDQLVVFYGSNSWAYTRLGHITDQTPEQMEQLLGHGDVTITLTAE